jgi:hypothetical protein
MAKERPRWLLRRAQMAGTSRSRLVQRVILHSLLALPRRYADWVARWILADPRRLSVGAGRHLPRWEPARRLIARFSPHCSGAVFRELEDLLLNYHGPDEYRDARYRLGCIRQGHFSTNIHGQVQHHLLPALDPKRRSPAVEGMIGVLQRKFANVHAGFFLHGMRSTGGSISSPLDRNRIQTLSDRAWLGIICRKHESWNTKWRQVGPNHVTESSVELFARDLGSAAKANPARFAELALRMPTDVPAAYLSAVIGGLEQKEPSSDVPEADRGKWRPATPEQVEAVLRRHPPSDEREQAMRLCWMVRNRADAHWSGGILQHLTRYATGHADPKPGELSCGIGGKDEDTSVEVLQHNALNCVRGAAANAIEAMLFEHCDWLDRLRPTIESLVKDPHPAVRAAAVAICIPVLNIDRNMAVELFARACSGTDDRVAACYHARLFYNYAFHSHAEQISPVLLQMVQSSLEEVAKEGASQVYARWLFQGVLADPAGQCRRGTVPQRSGVAAALAELLVQEQYTDQCWPVLLEMLDDESAQVRKAAAKAFSRPAILDRPRGVEFALKFVTTAAFQDDPSPLLLLLEDHTGPVLPLADTIFAVCSAFAGPLAAASRDLSQGVAADAQAISPLLLRLYEQAQGQCRPELQRRCLDLWDRLLEQRVGFIRDLARQIDDW